MLHMFALVASPAARVAIDYLLLLHVFALERTKGASELATRGSMKNRQSSMQLEFKLYSSLVK
jgi:hypothetical protein